VTTLARTAPAGPPAYAIDSPAHPTLADLWTAELGRSWRLVLGALLALVALAGVAAPLADPDLPIHLATGEWITRHGALPFVEPFAWTRAGEPFYAYSWAIELAYFALWRAFGVAGLHLLHGVLLALAVASVLILGRVAGWRPWSVVLVSLAQLDIAIRVAAFLRPQLLLLILLPLVWALALLVWRAPSLRTPAARWSLLGLAVIGCVASNTHLLFPLTAVPCGLVALTAPRLRAGRAAALLGALALGWTVSPYTLVWPQMFAQNLGGNLRLQFPSAIGEYMPGFSTLWDGTGIVTAAILVALPWLLPTSGGEAARGAVTARERAWFGVAWSVGLVAFATASRALLVWWVAVLPLVGRAADQLPSATPSTRRLRTLLAFGFVGVLALKPLAVVVRQASAVEPRHPRALSALAADSSIGALVACLERSVRPDASGRILTVSDLGGYLAWRLPAYQRSIDGRTIFADSVSRTEVYEHPYGPRRPLGLYRSADLAILPLAFPVAAVLDSARGWRRLGETRPRGGRALPSGLWAREAWLQGVASGGAGVGCSPATS
jgi:hypothetical protein